MSTQGVPLQADPTVRDSSLAGVVARIAALLDRPHFPTGDRAALKRWAPEQPLPLAFYRLWFHEIRQDLPPETQLVHWMALVWGLALSGSGAHRPQRPLGQALAEAHYSEARLERLLSAPEALRTDLYFALVRFLSAKREGCDWTELAAFLLAQSPHSREQIHGRIAKFYYRHLPRHAD